MDQRHLARDNFFLTQWFDWAPPITSRRVRSVNWLLEKLGLWIRLQPPRHTGIMTNIEQRMNLWHLASQVLVYSVPGEFVELGCNEGSSSVIFQRIIDELDPTRRLHVYDSFEGLPDGRPEDSGTTFRQGQMETTADVLLANFRCYGLKPPVIHKGWFEQTLPDQLPEKICFAHLDGDLYESIKVSLEHVYPRLSCGAVCVIDDYADPAIWPKAWNDAPGVKRALDEYLSDKPEKVSFIYSGGYSHGFFYKK